uniref:Uncharacterized protein n=1 Tax=viral metagenome TaxID=1070528 RepID=A0A6H1ZLE8_9ZZZZ
MPDDVTTEVTEQIETAGDESAAFSAEPESDVLEDTNLEGLDQPEKSAEPDKKDDTVDPDKADKDTKADPDKDKAGKEKTGDEEEVETEELDADEDVARGKEVLEAQEQADADAAAVAAAKKTEKIESGGYDPRNEVNGLEQIEFMKGAIPPGLFPDTVTLKDGTVLDFKNIIDTDPEIPVMIATIANNIIKQMVVNKYLATHHDLDSFNESVDNRLFLRTITNKVDGVPKAREIYQDPKFKTWFGEQPKEIQALMKSPDPYDQIRVFKRYLNKSGLEKAGGKVAEIDGKRKKDKSTFDKIHKTTVKSKGKPSGSALNPREDELAGFTEKSKDDDDILS